MFKSIYLLVNKQFIIQNIKSWVVKKRESSYLKLLIVENEWLL